ncbi:MAG: 2-hydroxyacid dehydrogenase [Alphaproteobacteria bacterium]|nr:2-hydroxyacid dehydrogenase [Alphaproteobacteria bacterium]
MTSPTSLREITVLGVGGLSEQAAKRIPGSFTLARIARGDPALVTPDMASSVRGIANFGGVNAALIDALPNLEIIASFGVGYDSVDARHAATRGVMVTNTPDVLTEEVADTALGLLINTVRELPLAEAYLRAGRWEREGAYPLTGATLRGRRAGIFGMGRIGQAIARRLEAFGLSVAYHNRRQVEGLAYDYHPTLVSLAEAVDTLISVVPGGASTLKAVDMTVLKALGPNGVFVNIGRGTTVDEAALAKALADGTILAAGLDVFADEPRVPKALLDLPNASLLPHVGSASVHTRNAMADLVADNLESWFTKGRAITAVPETADVKPKGR